jgi:hypothetical protein
MEVNLRRLLMLPDPFMESLLLFGCESSSSLSFSHQCYLSSG